MAVDSLALPPLDFGRVLAGSIEGLDMDMETLKKILTVDNEKWTAETKEIEEYYKIFGDKLPAELRAELEGLKERLAK